MSTLWTFTLPILQWTLSWSLCFLASAFCLSICSSNRDHVKKTIRHDLNAINFIYLSSTRFYTFSRCCRHLKLCWFVNRRRCFCGFFDEPEGWKYKKILNRTSYTRSAWCRCVKLQKVSSDWIEDKNRNQWTHCCVSEDFLDDWIPRCSVSICSFSLWYGSEHEQQVGLLFWTALSNNCKQTRARCYVSSDDTLSYRLSDNFCHSRCTGRLAPCHNRSARDQTKRLEC